MPQYRKVDWPNFPRYEPVGRWESESFDPLEWRNDYPNPTFVRMTPRDAFWAAKIIMRFTPEELFAIVKTAEFSDPEHEQYFHRVLVERQRKSGLFGINLLNPLDEFSVSGNALEFTNLSETYGFVSPESTGYRVTWSLYDNTAETVREQLSGPSTLTATRTELPEAEKHVSDRNLLLLAELYSQHKDHPQWDTRIGVYLRSNGRSYEIVGIERDSPQEFVPMQ